MERKQISAIITNGKVNKYSWTKIDNIINNNDKAIFFPKDDVSNIVKGFKQLYNSKDEQHVIDYSKITIVLDFMQNNYQNVQEIGCPKSKAFDCYGFSQALKLRFN